MSKHYTIYINGEWHERGLWSIDDAEKAKLDWLRILSEYGESDSVIEIREEPFSSALIALY